MDEFTEEYCQRFKKKLKNYFLFSFTGSVTVFATVGHRYGYLSGGLGRRLTMGLSITTLGLLAGMRMVELTWQMDQYRLE